MFALSDVEGECADAKSMLPVVRAAGGCEVRTGDGGDELHGWSGFANFSVKEYANV